MDHRNINLDLMRFLGVLIIMIAHANPPEWLFQLRNFGTPLLVVASALTYKLIYSGREIYPFPFYKKRLKRLIIPAWIFLTLFFIAFLFAAKLSQNDYPFSLKEILGSYTFHSGIGFVWILKVYIILALLTPLALKASALPISNATYFLILSVLYLIYELAIRSISPHIPKNLIGFFNSSIFVVVPYSLLYLYGMRLSSLTNRQITLIATAFLSVFLLMAFTKFKESGHFVQTQEYKYPPTLYYLSYAVSSLNLVYIFCRNLADFGTKTKSAILWLASNSLWIYLWHIMAFYLWNYSLGEPAGDFPSFAAKASFLLTFGVAMTYVQTCAVKKYISANSQLGRQTIAMLT